MKLSQRTPNNSILFTACSLLLPLDKFFIDRMRIQNANYRSEDMASWHKKVVVGTKCGNEMEVAMAMPMANCNPLLWHKAQYKKGT